MKTNEEWLWALRAEGPEQDNALRDLRDTIIHGMLAYLTGHRGYTPFGGSLGRQTVEDCAQETLLIIKQKSTRFEVKVVLRHGPQRLRSENFSVN